MNTRKHPADRRQDILDAAISLAGEGYLYSMSGHQIGINAGCARTLINQYFKNITDLREHVIRDAVRNDRLSILAQALAVNDTLVNDITNVQRRGIAAMATVTEVQ